MDEGCAEERSEYGECGVSADEHSISSCRSSLNGGSSVCDTDAESNDEESSPAVAALRDLASYPLEP